MQKTVRGLLWQWGPLLFWTAVILAMSSDGMSSGRTSRFIVPLVLWIWPEASNETLYAVHYTIRKCAHLAEYALFALLAYRAVRAGRPPLWRFRWAAVAVGIAAAFASIDELRQSFTTTRTGKVSDVAIDTVGAILGVTALWLFARWYQRRSERS